MGTKNAPGSAGRWQNLMERSDGHNNQSGMKPAIKYMNAMDVPRQNVATPYQKLTLTEL